jgi:nicotinamidase-related amidase
MLRSEDVPVAQSALLVIDAQDSFKIGPRWEKRNNHEFEKHIAQLVDAYREASLPVIYFLHTDDDEGFATNHPAFKLMSFLHPRGDEPTLIKNTRNVFTGTTLQPLLLQKGIRRLAIAGIQMEQCCETTARLAADLGYAVDFVIDATLTFPIPNWDKPSEELGVKEIEERTKYALRRRFARIINTAQLESELKESGRRVGG